MKVKNKVFVVTGAGSGMGRELTLALLKKGAHVAMADINHKGMEETASLAKHLVGDEYVSAHKVNIADKNDVEKFAQAVLKKYGRVEGLINNAGIIQPFLPIKSLEQGQMERVMNVNFYGTLYMVKVFLPHLLEQPQAHIANVSSMGGFIPVPGQTLYGASKAAVKLLTEGLYAELRDTHIGVTVIHPGGVNTNIMSNSGLLSKAQEAEMKKNQGRAGMPADKAAAIMIDAIEKNKFRVLVGGDARFLDLFYRMCPQRAINFLVKKMSEILKKLQ